jgi:S-adenosylmethionine:tRNA ribosyltransferase-isomerase
VNALASVPEPAEARRPPEARGLARQDVRMLVAAGANEPLRHARFTDLPALLDPGDVLVINTSRTLPAALAGRRGDGAEVVVNLSTPVPYEDAGRWVVELRRRGGAITDVHPGEELRLPAGGRAVTIAPYLGTRLWIAALELPDPLPDYLARHGRPVRYRHLEGEWTLELHQTVYAREPGSAEMPSAGRPFTPELITSLVARGVDVAPVVLHTGVSSLEGAERPYPERFRVPEGTAERVNLARRLGGAVIAVGTTAVRALESAAGADGGLRPAEGWTDLVIGPERGVRAVDGVLTGFHDRNSSHLRMLEAIAGPELLLRSYRAASRAGYLRHEFGDLLLIRDSRG